MKKTLVFLLLVCLSLFTLTGCGKGVSTEKAATEDEMEDFFEDKMEALAEMMEEEYSYSFKYNEKSEKEQGSNSSSYEIDFEGRISIDPENIEDSALYIKGTNSEKAVEYGENGKVKSSSKSKMEITFVDEMQYFSNDYTETEGESKWTESSKEKTDFEGQAQNAIAGILKEVGIGDFAALFAGDVYYIEGDKCLAVTSTSESHVEVLLTFDGDELVSIECSKKSYGFESELKIEFGEIKSISKPKDASKYKSTDED